MIPPALRLVPTRRAGIRRLEERDANSLSLSRPKTEWLCENLRETRRPNGWTRDVLDRSVEVLRGAKEGTPKAAAPVFRHSDSYIEIPDALRQQWGITSRLLDCSIQNYGKCCTLEHVEGDMWYVVRGGWRSQTGASQLTPNQQTENGAGVSHESLEQQSPQPQQLSAKVTLPTTLAELIDLLPAAESSKVPYIPLNLTKPVSNVSPVKTKLSATDFLLKEYRKQLYTSRTSLIFFAKSALSKARALCKSMLQQQVSFKEGSFSENKVRKMSYKLYARELAKLVQPLHEWSRMYDMEQFTKMMATTSDSDVTTWKDGLEYSTLSSYDKLEGEVAKLKFREMQLQCIVILELMAVSPKLTVTTEMQKRQDDEEKKKAKKKLDESIGLYRGRRKKETPKAAARADTIVDNPDLPDYSVILTEVFAGMCIWQQLSDAKEDLVQEFCRGIIVPYFAARVPDKVDELLDKAGMKKRRAKTRESSVDSDILSLVNLKDSPRSTRESTREPTREPTKEPTTRDSPRDSPRATGTPSSSHSNPGPVLTSHPSLATRTASQTQSSQSLASALLRPQHRGGLLTSSRSFDTRSQVGMRFKGSKEMPLSEVSLLKTEKPVKAEKPKERSGGLFTTKPRDLLDTKSLQYPQKSQSQVAATPAKKRRARPLQTDFHPEPDNPFLNDDEDEIDDSPFAKRMRGAEEFSSGRRDHGVSLKPLMRHKRPEGMDRLATIADRSPTIVDRPSINSRLTKPAVTDRPSQGSGIFGRKPAPPISLSAPVATVATEVQATPSRPRRTQPTLTSQQYTRRDNPFYMGTDAVEEECGSSPLAMMMGSSPTKIPETPTRKKR